ncbi:MAG: hypothetical protein OIN66_04030 [Candidatus Methanoperedens sp.]|nr:hypothetical protein [Candidatus Methanoperedens sp.]
MKLDDIIKQIENVSKPEIKRVAPADCSAIKEIIKRSNPQDMYEKMVLGYLTSLCAEYMHPETFHLEVNSLDYTGFELERGCIEIDTAGDMLGACMRGGKIVAKRAGEETGSGMAGGEIVADEIKSIGNTIGGRITAKKVGRVSKAQGAEVFINSVRFKLGLFERLFGK